MPRYVLIANPGTKRCETYRRELLAFWAGRGVTPDVEVVPWADVVPRDGNLDGLAAFDRPAVVRLESPGKDAQVTAMYGALRYRVDRLLRVAKPHALCDPEAGPLIAVRLWILTRKTLGGLLTDLSGRVLTPAGEPFPGLYAAGEVAGFGGGGMHGYRALDGTFLGGCLFSGRAAGRGASEAVA